MIAFNQTQIPRSFDEHMTHAVEELKTHGFNRYYNALVNAYVSDAHGSLSYSQFANATNRAKLPLTTDAQALMYSTLYAKNHFDRFKYVLQQVLGTHQRPNAQTKTIHVIDYGCGQALASLALIDYLEQYVDCRQMTLHIHLVEPSATTLTLAKRMVTAMTTRLSANSSIHEHHGDLSAFLRSEPLSIDGDDGVVHLLSNVLDIDAVQAEIPKLSARIAQTKGKQVVFGVGPNYTAHVDGLVALKNALDEARVKQAPARFDVASERYSIKDNHWQPNTASGTMMALCYHNTALNDDPHYDAAA